MAQEQVPASPPAPLGRALWEGRGRRAAGRDARPLAGAVGVAAESLYDSRLSLTRGAADWITVPVKISGCEARLREGATECAGRPGPLRVRWARPGWRQWAEAEPGECG